MIKLYFDADGAILGRLGSIVCRELLKGKEVVVINAEKVIISGNRDGILSEILWWKDLGGKGLKGPRVSKVADRLMKRMIRGMLPWNRTRGREAYDRLRCYIGNGPLKQEELKHVKKIEIKKPLNFVVLGDICKSL